ncbi:MAG TPA: hypothetical protein VFV34_22340 [Blastocatellia bacterium]|nr:hypothetical protein [Blastocatellia bacterium]
MRTSLITALAALSFLLSGTWQLRVPAQEGSPTGIRILLDQSLFDRSLVEQLNLEALKSDSSKIGLALPETSRPTAGAIRHRYGNPDMIRVERIPMLSRELGAPELTLSSDELPIIWEEMPVMYYGKVGFVAEKDCDDCGILFVTNAASVELPERSGARKQQSTAIEPAAANYEGNWDDGFTSSNLFFTVVDNAVTNATVSNLRLSVGLGTCNDGGLISASYSPPIAVDGDSVSFTVSGATDRNIWIIDYDGTFSSDTRISGSESTILVGNCGFVLQVSSFSASKRPEYTLFTQPSLRRILASESASYSVGVRPLGGFNQPVQVEMLVPTIAGITFNLSSSTVQPGGTATINVATQGNASRVAVGIILQSTTGQARHRTLAILDLHTFDLSVEPADTQIIGKGQSATFTLKSRTVQFTNPTTLTSSLSPSTGNLTVSFASPTLVPGQSTTFTVSSAATSPSNTYSVFVDATAGSVRESVTARVRVSDPDFELALSPSPQLVGPGGSASLAVAVKPIIGFNGPVSLTTSVSPDNGTLTLNLGATTVSPGSSTTLTVNASASARQNDSFVITVRGVSGSLLHSTTATVRISGPDFSISFDTPGATGDRGTVVKKTLNIARLGGFSGNVAVTAPDTSAIGVRVKPPENSTTDPSLSFKFKIKAGATVGTHQLTFTGRDDSGRQRTTTLALTIQ